MSLESRNIRISAAKIVNKLVILGLFLTLSTSVGFADPYPDYEEELNTMIIDIQLFQANSTYRSKITSHLRSHLQSVDNKSEKELTILPFLINNKELVELGFGRDFIFNSFSPKKLGFMLRYRNERLLEKKRPIILKDIKYLLNLYFDSLANYEAKNEFLILKESYMNVNNEELREAYGYLFDEAAIKIGITEDDVVKQFRDHKLWDENGEFEICKDMGDHARDLERIRGRLKYFLDKHKEKFKVYDKVTRVEVREVFAKQKDLEEDLDFKSSDLNSLLRISHYANVLIDFKETGVVELFNKESPTKGTCRDGERFADKMKKYEFLIEVLSDFDKINNEFKPIKKVALSNGKNLWGEFTKHSSWYEINGNKFLIEYFVANNQQCSISAEVRDIFYRKGIRLLNENGSLKENLYHFSGSMPCELNFNACVVEDYQYQTEIQTTVENVEWRRCFGEIGPQK